MLTMTSLDAQNHFGTLIDTSQRQPVTVTRRGRPVAVVMSYEDYINPPQTIPYAIARLISEQAPLVGREAGDSMRRHLAALGDRAERDLAEHNRAERDGLTEAEAMRLLDEQ